jgi:hypothetical protein
VSSAGQVVLSGYLADGTALSQSAYLSKDGRWPLYSWLYSGGKGSVFGWLFFTNTTPPGLLGGTLSWLKPSNTTATKYYPLGFTNELPVEGSRYAAPPGSRVIDLTNGVVAFEDGNLALSFTNAVALTTTNSVRNLGTNRLTFSLSPSSGVFSGTVAVPGTRQTNTFRGALLQDLDSGYGYFLGTNQSGRLYFGPAPGQ